MLVSLKDIREAFEFVCAASGGEHQAFLCRQSGKLYCHSELCDDLDILPDDIDDAEKFLPIPHKRDLDLGKPVALNFAGQFLPGDFDDVRQFFSRKGADARLGSVGAKRRARSMVRFRGESRGRSLENVVRSSFDRGQHSIEVSG